MDALTEWLLKEIERQEVCSLIYGDVQIDFFDLSVWNQLRNNREENRYFATTANKVQVETKISIPNMVDNFFWKILFISIVLTVDIIRKETEWYATEKEIETTVKIANEYTLLLMSKLFREKYRIKQEGNNTDLLREIEREIFLAS